MTDLDKLTREATARAALAAGKDAAKRAVDELLTTDEERGAKEAARAEQSKARRTKWIVGGVLGVCLVVGVLGLLVSFWPYFLAAGVLGTAGLVGWWRLKKQLAERRQAKPEPAATRDAEAPPKERAAAANAPRVDTAELERAAAERAREAEAARARAAEVAREAAAEREQAIDDELAAMKKRIGKG